MTNIKFDIGQATIDALKRATSDRYVPSKERAKVIRKALAKVFGNENVSVVKGRGTASSWVEARVSAERPKECTCKFSSTYWNGKIAPEPFRTDSYCEACKVEFKRVDEIARQTERKAMEDAGFRHSTYTSDDGFNSEYSEFLLQIDVK